MSSIAASVTPTKTKAVSRPRLVSRLYARVTLVVVLAFILLAVPSEGYLGEARLTLAVNEAAGAHGFRLAAWEAQALSQKVRDLARPPDAGLDAQAQHDLVVGYSKDVARADDLAFRIEQIHADPEQTDPSAAAAPLQAELDALRVLQAERRPAVERILEQQTAAILRHEQLTTGGHIWPPVWFQFTESPLYLIVSPRNRIAVEQGLYLDPTLEVTEMEQIESDLQQGLDVSALVDGTGGFSSYPTMVIDYPSLEWVASTVAHEWTHTYLAFHPLGLRYGNSGEMRTINETVASIVGDELGRDIMLRYYPELVPAEAWPQPETLSPEWWGLTSGERPFEFGPFMRETRLTVDEMLADGKIDEAEAYMEQQREILLDHGYVIRKLNQAYFAFHGSYAVGPTATDPIGGKLRALRQRSESLTDFLHTVSSFTTPASLDAALSATEGRN